MQCWGFAASEVINTLFLSPYIPKHDFYLLSFYLHGENKHLFMYDNCVD